MAGKSSTSAPKTGAKASAKKALGLHDLVAQARAKVATDEFHLDDAEFKPSSTGNVGIRAKTTSGKVITFWSSNMDEVVEAIDDAGNYRVKPGVTIASDGGLIPAGAQGKGFWD